MVSQWKSLFRFRIRTLLLWLVILAVGWSAYSYWSDYRERAERAARELLSPPAGALCTVVFNSNALGLRPGRVYSSTVNGIKNSVHGRFIQLNDDWIVLESRDRNGPQQWISRQHVLLLQVEE